MKMLQISMSKDMKIFFGFIVIFLFTVGVLITQPTFTSQTDRDETIYIKAKDLKEQVYKIVKQFDGRSYHNIELLDKTAEYIYNEFSRYSEDVNYQEFETKYLTKYKYKNVIAKFKGEESCSDGIFIVGGHYDTYAGRVGANDNTSSVASLIELAHVLKENPPKCDTEIVAYSLEEPPFFGSEEMGSFFHAKSLKERNQKVKLVIVLDMIGFFSDESIQKYPAPFMKLYYPSKANFISIVSNLSFKNIKAIREAKDIFKRSTNLLVYSINAFEFISGIDFSDHRNYWKFDYTAIFITDTAFYRSNNYHTRHDTPDTLDYDKMAKVVEGVLNLIR
jgi:hypothetical protein